MKAVFVDIETNGLDPFRHDPLEIALIIADLESGKRLGAYEAVIQCNESIWDLSDPKSIVVNGFSAAEFQCAVPKDRVAAEIIELINRFEIVRGRAFFMCQNPSFDRPFFAKIINPYVQERHQWPYHWLDLASMYWAKYLVAEQALAKTKSVSKDEIAKRFGLHTERHPHRAMNGVLHLLECYEKVVGFPGC